MTSEPSHMLFPGLQVSKPNAYTLSSRKCSRISPRIPQPCSFPLASPWPLRARSVCIRLCFLYLQAPWEPLGDPDIAQHGPGIEEVPWQVYFLMNECMQREAKGAAGKWDLKEALKTIQNFLSDTPPSPSPPSMRKVWLPGAAMNHEGHPWLLSSSLPDSPLPKHHLSLGLQNWRNFYLWQRLKDHPKVTRNLSTHHIHN